MGQRGKKVRTSKALILANRRAQELCDLRVAGKSLEEAAEIVGYPSASGAQVAITAYLKNVKNQCAKGVREIYYLRLEKLHEAYYEKAMDGDIESAKLVAKTMEQGAKLLGLNAPTQQTTVNIVDSAFIGMGDKELNQVLKNLSLEDLTDLGTQSKDLDAIDVDFEES